MNNQILIVIIITSIVFWMTATIFAFLKKHKIFALAVFFTIPTALIFLWIMATIVMLTVTSHKDKKTMFQRDPTIYLNEEKSK